MKTYRVKEIDKKILKLEFEVYVDEEVLNGNEPDIEFMVENPEYYFEDDWVYITPEGKIGHIDEREFTKIVSNMSKARIKSLTDPSYYDEFKAAEAKWIYALGHPALVEDEEEYYKSR